MASRTSSASRSRSSAATRQGGKDRAASARSGRSRTAAAPRAGRGTHAVGPRRWPLPLRAVRGMWMGCAHVVGSAARRVGNGARDLDPAHRRDGAGLVLLAAAIVVAAREWWGLDGSAATPSTPSSRAPWAGSASRCRWCCSCSGCGCCVTRTGSANGRVGIGLTALTLSAAGLVHLTQAFPTPPDGAARMRDAGGMIGFLASSPLASALTVWVATPLLALLGFFGLLVVTATPVHAIPQRLRPCTTGSPGRRARPATPSRRAPAGPRPAGPPRPDGEQPRAADAVAVASSPRGRRRRGVRDPGHRRRRPRPGAARPAAAAAAEAPGGAPRGRRAAARDRPGRRHRARGPVLPAGARTPRPAPRGPAGWPGRCRRTAPAPAPPRTAARWRRRPRPRCPRASSSSPSPATSRTRCRRPTCWPPGRRTRRAAWPTTGSSSR